MGIFRDLFRGESNALIDAAASGPTFAVDADSVPPEVFGLASYSSPTAPAPRIDRRSAIQVPAVKRSRDLIAGTLGGLPLDMYDAAHNRSSSTLLEQPEQNVPRSVTMTRTFEDLLFEKVAWWQITEFGWHTYPTKVKRIDPKRVTVDEDRNAVYVDGKQVSNDELIRFDSPTDGLLIAGARAIRTCLTLDAAAANYANGTPPMDYFVPSSDVDPFEDDDEAREFLSEWNDSRKTSSTAYVPAQLKYEMGGWNPEQLQLADARQHAVLEIARVAGVDPEELGVSTTSRTYANQFDRRKTFVDFTLGQYRQAFEDRLSMTDVTPRGYFVKFNLDAFLRSSTLERYQTYEIGLRVGALDQPEIRDLEDKPALAPRPAPTDPELQEAPPVAASATPTISFDDEPVIRLDVPQDGASFAVDYEARTISGLIVPYGVEGIANGQRWVFSQGTLKFADPKRVKLWIQHDKNRVVGFATTMDDRPDGMYAVFSIEEGDAGDEALRKADPEGSATWDAFSIGLRPGGKFRIRSGVNYAVEAPLMETSLTPAPSFDDARVHAVAASADPERNTMKCTKCGQIHAAGIVECTAADVATFEAENSGTEFSAITDAIAAGFAGLGAIPPRETVNPTDSPQFEVSEAPLYRFDGLAGQRGFVEDLRAANFGDTEARQLLDEFMNETFAVTAANTAALNPTQNRPDLYVPNLQYARPLWEMVSNGSVEDKTPFTIPKFVSATGLVAPHVENVEPTPGAFAATSQTVTPAPSSGKIEIVREVLDQGGSPQADQIIWAEILNGWYEAIETKIATTLAAVPTAEVNLASAVDKPLVNAFTNLLTGLQFVRGGNRFTSLALDGMTFPALVNAADSTGRNLLPVLGPSNAEGGVTGAFDRVNIGNLSGRAAWALGSGNASKSYLFVPSSVYAWASAPKRFTFEYQVKSVDIAIWGYTAAAVTRDSDVRPIDYTTADV